MGEGCNVETVHTQQPNNKTSRIKALSPIVVAIISLLGMVFVAWLQSRAASSNDLKSTIARINTTVTQLNNNIIPEIQKQFQELQYSYREISKDESAARERIARLEGIIEALPRHLSRHMRGKPATHPKSDKIQPVKPVQIPFIDIQQTAD